MIKLSKVCKQYESKDGAHHALIDASLSVKSGEIFGVIGRSGAGKSTLLRCINFLEQPTSGEVWLDDQCVNQLSAQDLQRLRRQVGMIFQGFNLLSSRTVYQNIILPLVLAKVDPKQVVERVDSLLEITGLTQFKDKYPSQISGGQKQRVAIARALVNQPKILLCDELTSALDVHTTSEILDLLKSINAKFNITIILITHELDVIRRICQDVALMDEGKIIEQQSTLSFFAKPQTDVGRRFVNEFYQQKTQGLNHRLSSASDCQWRVILNADTVEEPWVYRLTQQFEVEVKILQATIETMGNQNVGLMLLGLNGNLSEIRKAHEYLLAHQHQVEELADAE